jgi:cyanate permease
MSLYAVGFWLPSIIKATGVKTALEVGQLTAIPYAAAMIAMVLVSRSSDRHRERRWHVAVPLFLGSVGLVASTLVAGNVPMSLLMLSIATAGIITAFPLFWSFPTAFLGGAAAAAGIALINSIGNLAGFVSPYMVGFIKDATQSTNLAMYVLAGALVVAAILVLTALPARLVNR